MSPWAFVFIQILAYLTVINGLESIFAERNDIDSNGFENSVSSVDPDAYLTPLEIIRRHGYPAESHIVQTEDGYLLTLHRIPGNRNREKGVTPVFLQHGLESSSADFVDSRNKSLAFLLADLGFDVWLGNARGNKFSRAHVSMNPHQAEFWNFSWHEMGKFDLPASIEFVATETKQPGKIIYIGHSMGTTMFFVYSSLNPSSAQNIKAMVALAPVADLKDIKSPVKYFAPFADEVDWIAEHLGINQFLPSSFLLKYLAVECERTTTEKEVCKNVIYIFSGHDDEQSDENLLPIILNNAPAGSSTKTILHYAQLLRDKNGFRMFNYGKKKNQIIYGSDDPPLYELENIKVPMLLMYAQNDWLASIPDVQRLDKKLKNKHELYLVPYKMFNHVDFLWAKDAPTLVYKPLIKYINRFLNLW